MMSALLASSRVNPLPQDSAAFEACAVAVGAGSPAKGPAQVKENPATTCHCDHRLR
ncbi:hypothetical protein DW66_1630 [Pseudomonas putida]|nr:hypothetical protein DW66_1269 [Pseudomonas putida]AHZ76150.1 hypothetical protein DW66_1630 [Pseudomonas putida]AJG15215.1 hypothetical protein RK21_03707 [Pseudomonas plecoglossicida]